MLCVKDNIFCKTGKLETMLHSLKEKSMYIGKSFVLLLKKDNCKKETINFTIIYFFFVII